MCQAAVCSFCGISARRDVSPDEAEKGYGERICFDLDDLERRLNISFSRLVQNK